MKKNVLFALLCTVMCICFIACKGGDNKQTSNEATEVNEETSSVGASKESEEMDTATPAEEEEDAASKEENQTDEKEVESSHLSQIKPENIILPKEIRDAVEIIPEDDGYVYCDFNEYDYPSVSLTFKLLKPVNTASINPGQFWIVGHAQDIKGRNIDDLNPKNISSREWRAGDSDGSQFKGFLEGDVDETITLDFTGENNFELFEKDQSKINAGKKQTADAAKKFEKFKLTITE